jgi:subtilisin-like proprotein convertase family protein
MRRRLNLLLPLALVAVLLLAVFRLLTRPGAADSVAASAPTASGSPGTSPGVAPAGTATAARRPTEAELLKLRLSNTPEPYEQVYLRDEAILLANATLDTRQPLDLAIPAALRATTEPAAYVIQARGPITPQFRAAVAQAGAQVVSFIPNNALLVSASAAGAQTLRQHPLTQAVLAWEPYFKLSPPLLDRALHPPVPDRGTTLAVTLFAECETAALGELQARGVELLARDRSPFGPVVLVYAPPGRLAEMARLPGVQAIEEMLPRVAANDLSRVRMTVAEDTLTNANYLNLSGTNVLVAVVDTGVDASHPDLAGRVFGFGTNDTAGHGTFVAGIIASSGANGPEGTNASGSVAGANFRGLAPAARIYSVAPTNGAGLSDADYQEAAALTNAFLNNNSWYYATREYSLASASYDAAVRDALPTRPGSQPALYVFAAGDAGGGSTSGSGGSSMTVLAPGTAKNVITVGSIEQPRNITNTVMYEEVEVAPLAASTDSDNQVAATSSRGNVGLRREGPYGRFKPDVVAPGVAVVSCRASMWDTNSYYHPTNSFVDTQRNEQFATNQFRVYPVYVPENAVGLNIYLTANRDTPTPFPRLPIFVRTAGYPDPVAGTYDAVTTNVFHAPPDLPLSPVGSIWYFGILNTTTGAVSINVNTQVLSTNADPALELLEELNDQLGAPYRYESGTSMAAAKISGFLALLQEYFEQRLQRTNSPALMKALLINGARSLGNYGFATRTSLNYQGWGLPKLTTTLPPGIVTNNSTQGQLMFFDQSPTNALATGDSQTRLLKLDAYSVGDPLRFTLVWTDPPGNPAASLKLVNNLDLVVTNLDTGEVFFGNDFRPNFAWTSAWATNALPSLDAANNVENVYLAPPLSTNYSVTVRGTRVNVNALTVNTNSTVQDYALVISTGDGVTTNGFTLLSPAPTILINPAVSITALPTGSNGFPILKQVAGASAPLANTNLLTNAIPFGALCVGVTNQWTFYVITNGTEYTNATFRTSSGKSLSLPPGEVRGLQVTNTDVDLYVSTDPQLTNLAPAAVIAADKSLRRGANELVTYSNSAPGVVYYVGIKCESQMGGEFIFRFLFTELPYGVPGADGFFAGHVLPATIPDGSPEEPAYAYLTFNASPVGIIQRVAVRLDEEHENLGDLVNLLTDGQDQAELQNHTYGATRTNLNATYDDSGQMDLPGAVPTDGPEHLDVFLNHDSANADWQLYAVDNALFHTGSVLNAGLKLDVMPENLTGDGGSICLTNFARGARWVGVFYIPASATNFDLTVDYTSGPLRLYMRQGAPPTAAAFDRVADIAPPGGELSWSIFDNPPLPRGWVYFMFENTSGDAIDVCVTWRVERSTEEPPATLYTSREVVPILDDAITTATMRVTNREAVFSVEAGLRIAHPRVSDLTVTLISPRGTRVLLADGRGYASTNGFGSDLITTNIVPVDSGGGYEASTNVVDTGLTSGAFSIAWNFFVIPDQIRAYYEGNLIFDSGFTSGSGFTNLTYGPGNSTLITITVNEGNNPDAGTLWEYVLTSTRREQGYAVFTENTNRTQTPIKFAVPPFGPAATNRVVVSENFESVAVGVYDAGSVVGMWTVTTNSVTVTNGPVAAHSPSNFVSLGYGALGATLATEPGQSYNVVVVSRLGQSLPINGSFEEPPAAPATATAYPAGAVFGGWQVGWGEIVHVAGPPWVAAQGTSFVDLNGTNGPVLNGAFARDVATVPAQPYLLEFAYAGNPQGSPAVKSLVASWNLGATLLLDFDTTGHAPDSLGWTYTNVTVVGTGNDQVGFASTVTNTAFGPLVDDVTLTPLGAAEVYAHGLWLGSAVGTSEWQTNSFSFTAVARATPIEIVGTADGLMVDSIQVTTVDRAVYYFPEAKLSAFDGEPPYGDWTLEIWDARAGATNPAPVLLGWQLRFLFQNAAPATGSLGHGQPVTNSVPPGGMLTYAVAVPAWASYATNTLIFASGPLNLLYNAFQPPAASGDASLLLLTNSTGGVAVLSGGTVPQLVPGTTYYLGIQNLTSSNVNFALEVDFDITTLTNAVAYTGVVLDPSLPRYFRFEVSSNATAVAFALTNLSGNADLYVRKGAPLPTPGYYDYASAVPGDDPELVLVFTNSAPVALAPGTWYLGVFNNDTRPVRYTVVAVEITEALPVITPLTNAVPFTVAAPPGGPATQYYRFDVPVGSRRAQFDIGQPSGPLGLALQRGFPPLPGLTNFNYLALGVGTNDFWLTVFDYSQPVNLSPGPWFLAVINTNAAAVSYSVTATAWGLRGTNIVLEVAATTSNALCFAWETLPGVHYVLQGRVSLSVPGWTDVSPVLTATNLTTTWCVPLPSPYHFFRIVATDTGSDTGVSQIGPELVITQATPAGVTLQWIAPASQQFRVEWSATLTGVNWTPLPGSVTSTTGFFSVTDDGALTGGLGARRFYRIVWLP